MHSHLKLYYMIIGNFLSFQCTGHAQVLFLTLCLGATSGGGWEYHMTLGMYTSLLICLSRAQTF